MSDHFEHNSAVLAGVTARSECLTQAALDDAEYHLDLPAMTGAATLWRPL